MTATALLSRTFALFVAGGLVMAVGSASRTAEVRRQRWLKFAVFFAIVHGVLALAALGRVGVVALVVGVLASSTVEAVAAWRRMPPPRPAVLALLGMLVAAGSVAAGVLARPPAIAWLFLGCAAFDGFSQVIGQWLGRTPLAPRLSPAKTLEGALGGCLAAIAVAVWLRALPGRSPAESAGLGLAIGAASLAGDLAGSWAKRLAGLKDYSALLPGHGGVLDRFNSFLATMALVGTWM
jgi:phosphatidate cytidylyltransferase